MIDIHSVRAAGREWPMLDAAQIRQARDEHHGRIANGEKDARVVRIDHAPTRTAWKRERLAPPVASSNDLKLRRVGVVADAGGNRRVSPRT